MCGSIKIGKLPSAPHLNLSALRAPGFDAAATRAVQQRLAQMVRQVVEKTEDVGERFAEEARRIHYNEVPAHGMPGIASAEQREELAEEGIDVFQLPIALPDKQSLQ